MTINQKRNGVESDVYFGEQKPPSAPAEIVYDDTFYDAVDVEMSEDKFYDVLKEWPIVSHPIQAPLATAVAIEKPNDAKAFFDLHPYYSYDQINWVNQHKVVLTQISASCVFINTFVLAYRHISYAKESKTFNGYTIIYLIYSISFSYLYFALAITSWVTTAVSTYFMKYVSKKILNRVIGAMVVVLVVINGNLLLALVIPIQVGLGFLFETLYQKSLPNDQTGCPFLFLKERAIPLKLLKVWETLHACVYKL